MDSPSSYRTNRDLFSNHYLDEHLPDTEAWDQLTEDELRDAKNEMLDLWEREKDTAPKRNESQLEERFIRPMFRKLGIPFEVEESTSRTQRRPDYAFFATDEAAKDAFNRREEGGDFYQNAVAVADAKRWGRPLDTRGSAEHERDFENPSYQIHVYLQETPTRWAVLTDGKRWRLYYGPTSHRLDSYYEVELPTILEDGTLEDFKYFYLFFRHEAFVEDASGDCFLDDVYDESNVFAQELGADLQDNIYEAIKILSEGFLQYAENDLSEDDLELIHDSSLIYLYRIIFVLYAEAEGRELLDTSNEIYEESYSLNSLKQEIADELDSADPKYRPWQTDLWSRLDELFQLIDRGSKSRGIPEEDLYIPAYDGGLFRTDPDESDSEAAQFLAQYQVGDAYLAEVIGLLTRSKNGNGGSKIFVDYSSLDVRHLGSVYEGLLEYQLNIADEPLAIEDGEYVPAGENAEIEVSEGEVYLTTDSGERKATGSYYTPEYVVEYIVDNTLGPLVEEIREDLAGQSGFGEGGFAGEFADEVFDLKILDPAMGSGHFLTSAVDYLAREIIDAQERQAAQEGIESVDENQDINWARRQVAQKCIYGVDLNPLAVELAKVSLWLRTLAAEQPLAFLDHHLKTGNSLVGSDIEEVLDNGDLDGKTADGQLTLHQSFARTRRQALDHVTDRFQDLLAIDNETLDEIKEMETVFEEVREDPLYQRLLAMADVYTADAFGLDVPRDAYERMAEALRDDSWEDIEGQDWFASAQTMAAEERFFHWELEFPVVFYGIGGDREEDAGFDAVIGNPPYRSLSLGSGQESERTVYLEYLRENYPEAAEYKSNIYSMFIDIGINKSRHSGYLGYIIPNTILSNPSYTSIRKKILDSTSLVSVVDCQIPVFDQVETGGVTILITRKQIPPKDHNIGLVSLPARAEFKSRGDIDQQSILKIPDSRILTDPKKLDLFERIRGKHKSLGSYASFYQGIITGDNKQFLSEEKSTELHEKVVRGRDINRHFVRWGGNYVLFDEERLWSNTNRTKFEEVPKILMRQTSDSLICAVDEEGLYSLDSTLLIHPVDFSAKYISSLLNSSVLNWYYQTFVPEEGEAFSQVKITNIKELPIASGSRDVVQDMESKYDKIEGNKERRSALNINILDYLGNYSEGPKLPDLGLFQPHGTDILNATKEDYENLRIGEIKTESSDSAVTIYVTARFKPEDDSEYETDQWGYTETEYLEAFTLTDLTENEATLIDAFVPVAVEEAGGFANFRETATKTNSLIDRLKAITLPDPDDVEDDLRRYMDVKTRADELDEKIERTDELIDEIVYDLYGLTDEEIEIVESANR